MKRSRFGEEQIIAVLKEQEAGMPTADVCRRHGISSATFYKWKSKYGGLEVSDARRLRQLEQENALLAKPKLSLRTPVAVGGGNGEPSPPPADGTASIDAHWLTLLACGRRRGRFNKADGLRHMVHSKVHRHVHTFRLRPPNCTASILKNRGNLRP
jgi:putative transposase